MRYDSYDGPLGAEAMLVHGPADGPQVLILAPLFGEANGTRATIVALARRLAEAGIGSAIPDLPGTGESPLPLAKVGWVDWREATAAAGRQLGRPHVVAMRGGALLDDAVDATSRWRFAPVPGATLLRQLERAQLVTDRENEGARPANGDVVELAGYRVSPALCAAMRAADPGTPEGPLRALPFEGPGLAPWRRAEPTADPELAARLADDIAEWIRTCAA
jgi:hypothetical protein